MADDRPLETTEEAVGRLDGKLADLESTLLARLSRRPVGDVELAFRGTPKPGTLFLQGQTVNRADYPDLWAWAQASGSVVAGGYGNGNGSTTFTLPDMRGRVLIGAGTLGADTYALGATGGASTRTLTTANMPAHDHNVSVDSTGDHSHSINSDGGNHGNHNNQFFSVRDGGGVSPHFVLFSNASSGGNNSSHFHGGGTGSDGGHTHGVTESSVGSGSAFDNRMPYLGVNVAVWT